MSRKLGRNPDNGGSLEIYKRRLGSADDEALGLNKEELQRAEAAIKKCAG